MRGRVVTLGVAAAGAALAAVVSASPARATPEFDAAKAEYLSAKATVMQGQGPIALWCDARTIYNEKFAAMAAAATLPVETDYVGAEVAWADAFSVEVERVVDPPSPAPRVWMHGNPVSPMPNGTLKVWNGSSWEPYQTPEALAMLVGCDMDVN